MSRPAKSIKLERDEYPEQTGLSGIASYCRDLYEEYRSSQYRRDKLEEIAQGRKRYKNDLEIKNFPWPGCSNKSLGLTHIAIDNLEPRIMGQLVGEEDFVNVAPFGPEDAAHTENMTKFVNWAVTSNMRLKEALGPVLHDLLLDGTVDLIPVWEEKSQLSRIRKMVPVMDIFGQRMEEVFDEREITRFKVDAEMVPITQAFFPDTSENWDEAPYLRFIFPTLYELEELSGDDGPYKNISEDLVSGNRDFLDERDPDQDQKGIRHSEYTKEVRCLECYVKWRNEWTLASFAIDAGWKEIRRQPLADVYPHGRKPVHRLVIYPESNESMGTGIPRKIVHYSTGCDDLFNIMIDCGVIEAIPWGFVEEGPGFQSTDMDIAPGKWIPLQKGSTPHPMNRGDIPAVQIISFIELLLAFFERTLSLMDSTGGKVGRQGKGAETYSGMALIVQEGNIRHQYMGEFLRIGLERFITDAISMYALFMPEDAKQRIFQNNEWVFQEFDSEALQGQFDYKLQISDSSSNKTLNRKERVELLQILGGNPVMNLPKLVEDLLRAYNIQSPGDYIKPEFQMLMQALSEAPEVTQVIQQFMQQRQQQNHEQDLRSQAEDNLLRQNIQRETEGEAGSEDRKLMDQVTEQAKRKILSPVVHQGIMQRMLG